MQHLYTSLTLLLTLGLALLTYAPEGTPEDKFLGLLLQIFSVRGNNIVQACTFSVNFTLLYVQLMFLEANNSNTGVSYQYA